MLWVLLLNFLLFSLTAAQKNRRPPRLKPGRSAFTSRIIRSRISRAKTRVTLSIAQNDSIVLDLEANDDLLSPDYVEYDISQDGQRIPLRKKNGIRICWFKGQIAGDASSQVIATDCNGFNGLIQRGNGRNYIAKTVIDDGSVEVYATDDEEVEPGSCGVSETAHSEHDRAEGDIFHSVQTASPGSRRLLDYSTSMNVVEIAVVSDFLYVQAQGGAYGRNLTAIAERNVQIVNLVQATYEATTFAKPTTVKLKGQYFFSSGDPYSMTLDGNGQVDSSVLLAAFRSWSLNLPIVYDHVHLLSYYNFQSPVIGLAYVGDACTSYKTGMSMMNRPVAQAANVVAHELGHNLGMSHDGQAGPPDTTACASTGMLMASTLSCPSSGLCSISPCSISGKNTYTNTLTCLYNWTNPTCNDGLLNGNETGVDCGGPSCPACPPSGCSVNNGGCAQSCTTIGPTAYVCGCTTPNMYLNATDGVSCVQDINQCLNNPCEETCTNTIGPGNSFYCSCTSPKQVSLFDGVSCLTPSCFDRRKNQNEVMVDCGGVCSNPCASYTTTASFQFANDRGVNLNGARWQTWNNSGIFQLNQNGVPVRYLYRPNANQWIYDDDTDSSGYLGTAFVSTTAVPYSGNQWQFYNGNSWVYQTLTFKTSSSLSSVCGNGILEGPEECESCLVYSGGTCVTLNPCCDSTCMSPALRGTQCSIYNLNGACWDGNCITRAASCAVITQTLACFGSTGACGNYTGGQNCDGVVETKNFVSGICNASFYCYQKDTCTSTNLLSTPALGPIRGQPCSSLSANGMYSSVCDGGPDGTGTQSSKCVTVNSLTNYATLPPVASTRPTTIAPSSSPTSMRPTLAPSTRPTTLFPTTRLPTLRPTTRVPTSRFPTFRPTTRAPVTKLPTQLPTTKQPSLRPTTKQPSLRPTTRFPTVKPTA